MLTVRHATERLEHVWHVTGAFTIPELKAAILAALREYFTAADIAEADRCLSELRVPEFMHEAVYRMLVLVLDEWPNAAKTERAIALLGHLVKIGTVSPRQVGLGFSRCVAALEDIVHDAPHAPAAVRELAAAAVAAGALTEPLPEAVAAFLKPGAGTGVGAGAGK